METCSKEKQMKIEILGTGCPKCKKMAELAQETVSELGISAEVVKVTDINQIMEFGVLVTPALAVNGDVKITGSLPTKDEIKELLQGE